ncbi:MAG: hypothetical protein V3V28_00465 [Polaribacter sp.]|uniref:hypothetical protein n=1 Tax=Polaribacter sp. TaxID=1920175 RepID=UPI002F352BD7
MNYFSQFWDEGRDDEYSSWGNSTWYFETNEENEILKQVTVYQNGKVIKYCRQNPKDEFGNLGDHALTIEDCDGSVIEKDDFYNLWS